MEPNENTTPEGGAAPAPAEGAAPAEEKKEGGDNA